MGCTLGAARQAKKEEKTEKAMFDREKPPDKGEENVLPEQQPVPADDDTGKEVIVDGGNTNDSLKLASADIYEKNKNELPEGDESRKQKEGIEVDELQVGKSVEETIAADASDQDMVVESNDAIAKLEWSVNEEQREADKALPPPAYQTEEDLPPPPAPFGSQDENDVSATPHPTASTEDEEPSTGFVSKEKSELVIEEPGHTIAGEHEQEMSKEQSYEATAQEVVKQAIEAGMEQVANEHASQVTELETLADSTAEQVQMTPQGESVDENEEIGVVEAEQVEPVDKIEQMPEALAQEGESMEGKAAIEPTYMPSEPQQEPFIDGEPQVEPQKEGGVNFESTAETLASQIINDAISMSTESRTAGKLEEQTKLEYQPPTVEEYLCNFEHYQKHEAVSSEYRPPTVEEYLSNFEQYQKCETLSTEYQPPNVEEYLANFEQYQQCETVSVEYHPPSVEEYLANFEQYQKCETVSTEYQPPTVEEYIANFEQSKKCETALVAYQPLRVEEYIGNFEQNQTCETAATDDQPPTVEQNLINFEDAPKCDDSNAEQNAADFESDQTDYSSPTGSEQNHASESFQHQPFIEKESEL